MVNKSAKKSMQCKCLCPGHNCAPQPRGMVHRCSADTDVEQQSKKRFNDIFSSSKSPFRSNMIALINMDIKIISADPIASCGCQLH